MYLFRSELNLLCNFKSQAVALKYNTVPPTKFHYQMWKCASNLAPVTKVLEINLYIRHEKFDYLLNWVSWGKRIVIKASLWGGVLLPGSGAVFYRSALVWWTTLKYTGRYKLKLTQALASPKLSMKQVLILSGAWGSKTSISAFKPLFAVFTIWEVTKDLLHEHSNRKHKSEHYVWGVLCFKWF